MVFSICSYRCECGLFVRKFCLTRDLDRGLGAISKKKREERRREDKTEREAEKERQRKSENETEDRTREKRR